MKSSDQGIEINNPEVQTSGKKVFDAVHKELHFDEPINQKVCHDLKNNFRKRKFFMRVTLILIILNVMLIIHSFSQTVTLNNISIENSALISVNGELLSNTGTTINNNGTFEVNGDFINNSGSNLFGTSEGTVTFTGINHAIGGNTITCFNNLTLQVSGNITLLNDIITGGNNTNNTGVFVLGGSLLLLNSKQLTINNSSPNAITRTTGFIVSETNSMTGYGKLKWMIKNNSGNYIFPFGNTISGNYLPVTFEITVPGVSVIGNISVATFPTATNSSPNNRPLPSGLTSLINHYGTENAQNVIDRWWMVDVNGYSNNPTSSITFSYRDSEWNNSSGSTNTISENSLQAQSNNYSIWSQPYSGATNTSLNFVRINGINLYDPLWTLSGNNTPLPVELISFDAKLKTNNTVDLNWITATEINNDFFTLEKSTDGNNFQSFEIIQGAGNSSNILLYNSIDRNPYQNITYYRLKQTDFDGKYSYSTVKAVKMGTTQQSGLFVYPNPTSDYFFIKLENFSAPGIVVTDVQGKIVYSKSKSEIDTTGIVKVDCSRFSPGLYFVTARGFTTEKIVIK